MRDLEFIINGQMIKKDPACSFSNIVAGSTNFYNAKFDFSAEWTGFSRVAMFETGSKTQYMPIIKNQCKVPDIVSNVKEYSLSVIGKSGNTIINTNKVKITQSLNN